MKTAPTVGVVMIVKNEEHTLPRLAASLRGQVDHWTVVDTGSTDRTPVLVPGLFEVPGQLIRDEFKGFGPSRNVALEHARAHTDWLLTIDADETVEGPIRAALGSDGVDAVEAQQFYGPLTFWLPRLLSSRAPWRWEGRAHEYLSLGDRSASTERTDAFTVHHHADGGSRGDKLPRELSLLLADLQEGPDDPRTVFYVARTYDDLGDHVNATAHYRRRAELPGWDEETWYARWRLGSCLLALGRHDEAAGVLMAAWSERPWRAEPLHTLAQHYRSTCNWRLAWEIAELAGRHTSARPDGVGPPPDRDRLFVHEDVYRWGIAYERSISAYYVDRRDAGRRLCDYLLSQDLPDPIRDSVESNRAYYR